MFNIENLITPKLQEQLDAFEHEKTKAVFLLRILDYETYFPHQAYDIAKQWMERTGTRYIPERYAKINDDKEFILKYAEREKDLSLTKKLINDLCEDINNGSKEHGSIIQKAKRGPLVLDNMDGFTFLLPDGTIIEPEPPKPKELPKPKKRTLAETLAFFKEIAEYEKHRR